MRGQHIFRIAISVMLAAGFVVGSVSSVRAAPSEPLLVTIRGAVLSQEPHGGGCQIVIDVISAGVVAGPLVEVRGRMELRQGCLVDPAGTPVSGEVLASNTRVHPVSLEDGIRATGLTASVAGTLAQDGTLTAESGRPNGRIVIIGDVLTP